MITISVTNILHQAYAELICQMIEEAAQARGTGIAKRDPNYIRQKIVEGKAVIALQDENVVGFCYIETWENQKYVANSGLIVHPDFRKTGLAKSIKRATLELSKNKYPQAKLFGITTSLAVMKINSDLGYKPVTFSEITQDDAFWKGCQSCRNYDILMRNERKLCLCTGMMYDLSMYQNPKEELKEQKNQRWTNFNRFLKLRSIRLQRKLKDFPIFKHVIYNENNK